MPVAVCANEGLWSEADAYARISARQADVYCFSPYWVGSLAAFHRLAHVAHLEGLQVCKHTHGELGLAAAACAAPAADAPERRRGPPADGARDGGGHPRRAAADRDGPRWGVPEGAGLGVEVDVDAVRDAARRYELDGQYLPYQREHLARWSEP